MKRILTILVAMAAFLATENTADAQILKKLFGVNDIGDLLISAYFAFYGKGTLVREFVYEPFNDGGKICFSVACARFATKVHSVRRIESVLYMCIHNVFSKHVKSVHGIPLTAKNRVGGIKVDADIVGADRLNGAQKGYRCFLTGLKVEAYALALAVISYILSCTEEAVVFM